MMCVAFPFNDFSHLTFDFAVFLQEAALHEKLHPHESLCVFYSESCDCIHQGRGSVRCRGDGELPAVCECTTQFTDLFLSA